MQKSCLWSWIDYSHPLVYLDLTLDLKSYLLDNFTKLASLWLQNDKQDYGENSLSVTNLIMYFIPSAMAVDIIDINVRILSGILTFEKAPSWSHCFRDSVDMKMLSVIGKAMFKSCN